MELAGDFIGKYRLLRKLASGQNSVLWEALDDCTKRRVVVKLLSPEYRFDRAQIALQRREFEVGAAVKHPLVIQILELLDAKGSPALIVEYFDGLNLKSHLTLKGVAGMASMLDRVLPQTVEGLVQLHKAGWVHRDVKPENFLANDACDVRLIDLALADRPKTGLARWFAGKSKIQGTRSYMSPEQIRGRPLDVRADVYSLGCMFHHLAAGVPPYVGNSSSEVLQKHLTSSVPNLQAQSPHLSREFCRLTARMMAKQPEHRPESCLHVLAELKGMRIVQFHPDAA